ncbi:MAG: acriflavin resistance protein [Bacteroidetes bacterium 4484_276]|nr:MAG: acriflavin resistance protein [Bacteroidetes bacterium 4484_276]
MRKLVSIFIKFPFYANMIIALLIIGGAISFGSLKKSFFPERSERFISVSVFYPGASPKEMEEGITSRVEEAIRSLVGIKRITSTSAENFSSVTIETTGEYDIDVTLAEVKNAVDGISAFPVDAERPVVAKRRSVSMAAYMGLTGEVDLLTLKNYAQEIEDDLLTSGVISQLGISGYPAIEISVEVTEENLLRYNLTFDQIARAISANNQDISAGMIRSETEEILIRSRSRTTDPAKLGEIIIRGNDDGSKLYLRDIADIKLKFSETPSLSLMNGEQTVSFNIQKLPEEDLAAIVHYLDDYAETFNNTHDNARLAITYNFLQLLNSRLELLYRNGGIGLLLVLVALGLFLSLRLSFWVAFGIPASFFGMFLIGYLSGLTINMISLFGMILVIGILVDDGIVIAENIYAHFEKGKSPKRAALDGTLEVMPAVLTSVTTTIVAFSPLLFLSGNMEFSYDVGWVVIVSLAVSLLEAFFVLPAHLSNKHVLKVEHREGRSHVVRQKLDKAVFFMRDRFYGRIMRFAIRWKWVMLVAPTTFFPSIPFDQFTVNLAFTPGTGEAKTLEYLNKFDDAIWEVNADLMEEYDDTLNYIDYTFLGLGNAFDGREAGAHAGNIFVLLRNMEGAPISSFVILDKIREKIGPVNEAEKFVVSGQNRFGDPVSISLLGRDLDELEKAKAMLINGMNEFPQLRDIVDNNAIGKREVQLDLKPTAYFLGLNRSDIAKQVRQGFFGGQAQRLQVGKDEVRVWVRYPKQDRISLGQLEQMKIKTMAGEYPLNELADYRIERGPVNINRYNGKKEIKITAQLVDPYEPVPPILERVENDIVPLIAANYPGISVDYQGQSRDSAESMADLLGAYIIAFIIIIFIIMMHFKSIMQALIILMMIPMAWLGATWGHGIEGIPVSMLSAWGMVALSGVIINDAIVFLAKYNSLLQEGLSVTNAAYRAGLARFRPILLTSLTTVVGLYPIILEGSFQAQFLKPMAITMAYGVLFGTSFILLFFPVLIIILNDLRFASRKNWIRFICWYRDEPAKQKLLQVTREEVEPAVRHLKITID